MKLPKFDLILGLLGLALTITMFLAQGPYDSLWKYALAFSPLVGVGLISIAYHVFLKARYTIRALLHAKEAYDLITATDIKSTFTARVTNTDGDLLYERHYRVVLVKNGVTIRKTRQDLVGSEVPIENFPPQTVIKNTKPKNIQLHPTDISQSATIRGNRQHHDYRWCYEIVPPMRNKGDFIDYGYSSVIPKCEAKAFTDSGSIFFFHHEALPMDIHYSLIAPPNFKIHIFESWMESRDGERLELQKPDTPQLDESGQILQWKPSYQKGSCFICKYRFTPA